HCGGIIASIPVTAVRLRLGNPLQPAFDRLFPLRVIFRGPSLRSGANEPGSAESGGAGGEGSESGTPRKFCRHGGFLMSPAKRFPYSVHQRGRRLWRNGSWGKCPSCLREFLRRLVA